MQKDPLFPSAPVKIYRVSELTAEIRRTLEGSFEPLWVEGEISNLHLHSSGHLYLTLKDDRSQIRAVMFRSQVQLLAFEPADGMQVLCHGRLGVYEVRGEYQLILDFMEPRGLGALQLAFEQLKERLQKEGLFDTERKRPLPFLPQRIGIVTSPTGAAIRDLLQILHRRFPNLHILIRPTRVQGEGAGLEISRALDDLNQVEDLDLVILARGGGSLEDLWAFNEEAVARAIARSRRPVITGVGHEVDFTVADFVADLRAPTPSAAAELAVPLKSDLLRALQELEDALIRSLRRRLQESKDELSQWARRLPDPKRRILDLRLLLDDLHGRLTVGMARRTQRAREQLHHPQGLLRRYDPREEAVRARRELTDYGLRLLRAMEGRTRTAQEAFQRQAALLDSLSPLNVLRRGYSITRRLPSGEIVRDAGVLQPGDPLRIRFHQGEAQCRVESTLDVESEQDPLYPPDTS